MSLTLITAMTSLRVLFGAAGVTYSFFANKDKDGSFDYGEIPKSIFGQTVGGIFYDWLKDGTSAGYDKLLQSLDSFDADSINHDLQRAARKATLLATFFACQGCLADIKSERRSIWKRIKNVAWKDEDINWLVAVSQSLKDELKSVETATFDERIDYKELFSIFDKDNIANPEIAQKEFAGKLKEQTLSDIKNSYYAKFGGRKAVSFSQNAFDLLSEAINNGWEDFPDDKDFTIQLKLNAKGNRVKKYDWFHLVCIIFNEEYKVNEKIEAAIQKQTTLEQTALLKQIADFGRIENFSELEWQISDFREENYWLHKDTQKKQDKAQDSLDRIEEKFDDVEIKPKDLPKLVGRLTEKTLFVDRVGERDNLTEWLTQKRKKVIVVKAASGYGKTSLAMEVLHALAPDPKLLDERLDALLVFLCRDNEGEFSEVCKKADALLGKKKDSADSLDIIGNKIIPQH